MALTNKSMYAILGILSLSPSTGYDIKKYCDRVLSGFWNENFGHIYPTLKRMVQEGTIEILRRPCPDKKIVYRITSKGQDELNAWLKADTAQQPVRSEFMLKLLFSSAQPKEEVLQTLEKHMAQHEAKIHLYQSMDQKLAGGIPEISDARSVYLHAVLRRGILSSEAVIAWCKETIEELAAL